MFRWHTGQNEGVTGASGDHDLRSSTGEFCMCMYTGAAGERSFSAAWNLWEHGSAQLWLKKKVQQFHSCKQQSQRENRQICWCVRYIGRLFASVTQGSKCACSAKGSWFGSECIQLENTPVPSRCNWFPLRRDIYMNIQLTILTSNFFHT